MDPHRKGNSFHDQNVPGDSRLLDAITRRTPKASGMGVKSTHSGVIFTPKRLRAYAQLLPFQIYVRNAAIFAAPGVFAYGSFPTTTQVAPTDGTWNLYGKLVIDDATGAFESTDVYWTDTTEDDTATDYFHLLGSVDVVSGVIDAGSLVQYNYGPVIAIPHGGANDIWQISFI